MKKIMYNKIVIITDLGGSMKNYSRQREAILLALRQTKTHPTASMIYETVRKQLPNISLGTVYRNLSALSEAGEILSIEVGDGHEHFDGDISPHAHLHCRKCKSLTDAPFSSEYLREVTVRHGFSPETASCVVYGVCKNCLKNEIGGN